VRFYIFATSLLIIDSAYYAGLPHLAMSDDEYRSFVIPKGATVFPAVWGVLHDPQMYPDPDTFKPERFLNITPEGSYVDNPNVRDPRKIVFGCGRR
jgi:cytochrome P450